MHQPGTLPLHPTARHPHTGAPLRALYVRSDGRVQWPILGASPDDPPADPPKTDPPADPPKQDPPKQDPPKTDPPADLGFPPNTPVAEMTLEQQVAYHKHQSRKHESRASAWQRVAGDKTPEQVQADLEAAERLRQESLTDAQRQVEEATKTSRIEAAKDGARTALELALGHDPEKNDQSAILDVLDMGRFLTDDGRIDTAKVRAYVAAANAPSDKGQGKQHDFGGGSRGGQTGTGVTAGRSRYQERHGKKTDKADA